MHPQKYLIKLTVKRELIIIGILLTTALFVRITNLDRTVFIDNDEGGFLISANFMQRGIRPDYYLVTYPPFWFIVTSFTWSILGVQDPYRDLLIARTISLLLSLIAIVATYGVGKRLIRNSSFMPLIPVILLVVSPYFYRYSRVATPEMMTATLIIASVYLFLRQEKLSVCIAGLFLGLAVLSKYFGLLLIPIFLLFAVWKWKSKAPYLVLGLVVSSITLLPLNLYEVFIPFLIQTATVQIQHYDILRTWIVFPKVEIPITLLGFLGGLFMMQRNGEEKFVAVCLSILSIGILANPIFWAHHMVNVLPLLAIGAGYFCNYISKKFGQKMLAVLLLMIVAVSFTISMPKIVSYASVHNSDDNLKYTTLAEVMRNWTSPGDYVIAPQISAFVAGRSIPPNTLGLYYSFVRYPLTSQDLIESCEHYRVSLVVFDSRWQTDYPNFVSFLKSRYNVVTLLMYGEQWNIYLLP